MYAGQPEKKRPRRSGVGPEPWDTCTMVTCTMVAHRTGHVRDSHGHRKIHVRFSWKSYGIRMNVSGSVLGPCGSRPMLSTTCLRACRQYVLYDTSESYNSALKATDALYGEERTSRRPQDSQGTFGAVVRFSKFPPKFGPVIAGALCRIGGYVTRL